MKTKNNVRNIAIATIILGIGAFTAIVLAATRTESIPVTGMCCRRCAFAIEYRLKEIDGVQEVKTSFAKGVVEVTYDDGQVTRERLHEAIRELGFTVKDGPGASCILPGSKGACCAPAVSPATAETVF